MRIVSLLPSATEILFALGLDREIVGVSHECDFPPQARTKRVVIHSRLPHDATPAEIDRLVSEYVHRGESLYAVDAEALEALAPDLIVTQDLCHVCAASPDDLATALTRFDRRPEVLCLNPQDLGDVWRDILWVGEESRRGPQAEALLVQIGARLGALVKSRERRGQIVRRGRANMAQILGDNQIRRQSLQRLGIDGVQTFAAVHVLAHQPVNSRWRCIVRQARVNHYALRPRLWREITLVAHAHDFAAQAKREENFRSRREQRHDSHEWNLPHLPCG